MTFDVVDMVVDVGDNSDVVEKHPSSICQKDASGPEWSESVRHVWYQPGNVSQVERDGEGNVGLF